MSEPIFSRGPILKAVPETLNKAGSNEQWALATVEVQDREGDIIRVAGINLDLHRPECPVKVVGSQHKYNVLDDKATYPVMGKVKEFVKTTTKVNGEKVPALAFRYEYAKEGDQISPYAAKLKSQFDNGILDSFSARFIPASVKPLRSKGGRYDVTECVLDGEISACLFPMNPYATVLKALEDGLGEDFDKLAYLEQRIIELHKAVDRVGSREDILLKAFTERFDTFESKYVAQADDEPLPRDRRTAQPEVDEVLKALNATLAKLK